MAEEQHGVPVEASECLCCLEPMTIDLYVEYKPLDESPWLVSGYCVECISSLIKMQWSKFVDGIKNSTCEAELRRMVSKGPPINLRDPKALPCPNDGEVALLWFGRDGECHSAKLAGSLIGEERDRYWQELKDTILPGLDAKEEEAKQQANATTDHTTSSTESGLQITAVP